MPDDPKISVLIPTYRYRDFLSAAIESVLAQDFTDFELLISDDASGPSGPAAFSAMMLVGTQGRQYSYAELAGLLQDAGFADVSVSEAHGSFSLLCGRKR